MPPSLDKPNVPGGVSEPCLYNDHDQCRSPRCGCDCHRKAVVETVIKLEAGPEKACPKCGVKRPANEIYCRIDGSKLDGLLCGICGAGMNPEDGFCWKCSAPKGTAKTPDVNIPTPSPVNGSSEVDYAEQVLRGLQEEMANGSKQGNEGVVDQPQKVVEQPAGTQGSFKLVNRPNPNKIRGPQGQPQPNPQPSPPSSTPAGVVPRIKLPIKP